VARRNSFPSKHGLHPLGLLQHPQGLPPLSGYALLLGEEQVAQLNQLRPLLGSQLQGDLQADVLVVTSRVTDGREGGGRGGGLLSA